MPRPQVRPADRSRAARACAVCKASKKRCDASLPCSLCVTKGRAEQCRYPDSPRRGGNNTPQPSAEPPDLLLAAPGWPSPSSSSQPPTRERARGQTMASARRQSQQQQQQHSHISSNRLSTPHGSASETLTRESSPQRSQRPTMLRNARGEEVYIGNTAAISFLHFLQKTLRRYIGPSSFTDRRRNETMLEAEMHDSSTNPFMDDLGIVEKQDLIKCFMRVSNGILHLFSELEISTILASDGNGTMADQHLGPHMQRDNLACLYLLIAIGAQSRGSDPAEIQRAKRYFAQAQRMAFVDMLQDPSLCMVKIFLLMAMYMLGACRRNTAFMYIGIASRAATILGLHVPYQHVRASQEERAARRRTWMSLRVLDLLCSSILARPSSTPSIEGDEYETEESCNKDTDHRTLALNANYESSSIIEAIVQKFAKSGVVDIDSAQNYLQTLREWSQALPDALRTSPKSDGGSMPPNADHFEVTIGNIHVACTYYFGVIIVTRQFLIARIMSQLHSSRGSGISKSSKVSLATAADKEKHIQLSNACISSAVYMVELCYQASTSCILSDNMCILKAWLFSAGLVLGFSLLMDEGDLTEIRDAFSHVRSVLQKLARLSPQAEQYYDILTNFSSAIALYREQVLVEQKQNSSLYVEKIMTIESADEQGNAGGFYNDFNNQSHAPFTGMLRTPDQSVSIGGLDDVSGDFVPDFFGSQLEMPGFPMQTGGDIGVLADLEWLCYATA